MAAGSAGYGAGSNTELRWPHVTATAGSTRRQPPEADFGGTIIGRCRRELGRSRGSQVAPHASGTSHGHRERGRGRWGLGATRTKKHLKSGHFHTPLVFATSLKRRASRNVVTSWNRWKTTRRHVCPYYILERTGSLHMAAFLRRQNPSDVGILVKTNQTPRPTP